MNLADIRIASLTDDALEAVVGGSLVDKAVDDMLTVLASS
jgi:hypothetical protein